MRNPFRYFNSSPEVIRLAVMMYVRALTRELPRPAAMRHTMGSDRSAAVAPDIKRLGSKTLEDAAWQEVALDVEGVLDGGVDRQEALG